MSEAIIVFGKTARPGKVKTRFCPPLAPEEAAQLYDAFARDVMVTAKRYRDERNERGADPSERVVVWLAWDGAVDDPLAQFAREDMGFEWMEQRGSDLGSRLRNAVSNVRDMGAAPAIVVGTDSPSLMPEHLETARLLLRGNDVVFGPSFDGGYYLVGVDDVAAAKPLPEHVIFEEIAWSSAKVLEQSWSRAQRGGLLCDLMGFWYDIDTFEELKKRQFHLCDYLASRDPLVAQYTRELMASKKFEFNSR